MADDWQGQFEKACREAHAKLRDATRAAHRRLAERQAADMRANVPVDSGRLRNTIRIVDDGWNSVAVEVGDDSTEYLGAIEFGTSRQAPQPFVRPAAARAEASHQSTMLAEARARLR